MNAASEIRVVGNISVFVSLAILVVRLPVRQEGGSKGKKFSKEVEREEERAHSCADRHTCIEQNRSMTLSCQYSRGLDSRQIFRSFMFTYLRDHARHRLRHFGECRHKRYRAKRHSWQQLQSDRPCGRVCCRNYSRQERGG